jgi:pimeloyl-ACP methyl ester carboxylesterase
MPENVIKYARKKVKISLKDDKYLTINHYSIRYREAGKGPLIVLVHGVAGYVEEWEPAMAILKEKFRVIALDLPGHGLSDKPEVPYTLDFLTDSLCEFITTISTEKIILAGHSLGGAVCLNMVFKFPHLVERLVLLNSVFSKLPLSIRLGSFKFLPGLIRKVPLFVVKTAARRTFCNHSMITDHMLRDAYHYINEPGSLRAMFSIIHSSISLSGLKKTLLNTFLMELSRVELPTLILHGDKDRIVPNENSKQLHQYIRNSECICFKNCGHSLQSECYRQFCEQLIRFAQENADMRKEARP